MLLNAKNICINALIEFAVSLDVVYRGIKGVLGNVISAVSVINVMYILKLIWNTIAMKNYVIIKYV